MMDSSALLLIGRGLRRRLAKPAIVSINAQQTPRILSRLGWMPKLLSKIS
jgi:hypothetical protein